MPGRIHSLLHFHPKSSGLGPHDFDTPELYAPKCPSELAAAVAAQGYLRWILARADEIKVIPGGVDRYDRRLAEILLDDRRVAELMIEAGHARRYAGGARKGWCTDET